MQPACRAERGLRLVLACLGMGIVGLFVSDCFKLLEESEPYNRAWMALPVAEPPDAGDRTTLVLVSHTGGTGYDYAQEWDNLNYFLRAIPAAGAAADYYFARPAGAEAGCWPGHYANASALHFVCIRDPPCDLCTHSVLLRRLDGRLDEYHTVVALNTGSRGPMAREGWLQRIHASTLHNTGVGSGGCYRCTQEYPCSVSTFFIAVPARVAQRLQKLWAGTCAAGTVAGCSGVGEHPLLMHMFFWRLSGVYLHEQNITLSSVADCAAHKDVLAPEGQNINADLRPVTSVSRSLFIKYGGGAYRKRYLPRETLQAVQLAQY